jgi:polygalacturonase
MAKTIPQLTDATTVNAADELIIQQGGITKRATGAELAKGLNTINGTVNVRDFGAVGDGVADDTAAIQAAINAIGASGGYVYLPAGIYRTTSTITITSNKTRIQGQGNNTTITRSTDYGDTIVFTGDTATGERLFDVGISDIQITSTGLTTSGAHIKAEGVWRMTIKNIYVQDGFIGFDFRGLVAANISNIYLVFTSLFGGSATGRKYMVFRNAAAAFSTSAIRNGDVFITDFNLRGNTSNQITEFGLEIISADGLWFENGHIGNTSSANIFINGSTSEMINLVFFSNVMSDEGTVYSLLFDGNTSPTYNLIQFANCNFKSGGSPSFCANGIVFAPNATVKNVHFTGCTITEFGQSGVTTSSANHTHIYFSNCSVFNNGSATTGTFPAYNLLGGSRFISITGGSAYGSDQSYGIQLSSGHRNVNVTGVDLQNNGLGSVNGYSSQAMFSNCIIQGAANVASASTVIPISGYDYTYITGTTNINNVSAGSRVGQVITLQFQNALTVSDAVGNLQLSGNFTTTTDDTLTLMYNGAGWVEIARSTN